MLSWSKSVEKEATVKHSTVSRNPTGRGSHGCRMRKIGFGRKQWPKPRSGLHLRSPPTRNYFYTRD